MFSNYIKPQALREFNLWLMWVRSCWVLGPHKIASFHTWRARAFIYLPML